MACQSSLNRPQDRQTPRCLDQQDGSQALGDVGIRNRCHPPIGSLRNNDSDVRLRKRHLKSEFALPQTLSRLFHLL